LFCDLLVRQSFGCQKHHFALTSGQQTQHLAYPQLVARRCQ
jgi:hypothetical protein